MFRIVIYLILTWEIKIKKKHFTSDPDLNMNKLIHLSVKMIDCAYKMGNSTISLNRRKWMGQCFECSNSSFWGGLK